MGFIHYFRNCNVLYSSGDIYMKYSYGAYNKSDKKEQWIRITEGCPNNCEYCYEPIEQKYFEIPKITRNKVKIMDMNLICKDKSAQIIKDLGNIKVNNKVVYYELICGIDYRYLTHYLADNLKKSRFKNIRLAWDYQFSKQKLIKKSLEMLFKAGYKPRDITIFMICNWKTSYKDNKRKVDLCKVWNVKVADCWYDNQLSPNIKPIFWTKKEIKDFRKTCRKHNQLVLFKIDPEEK